jgi:hypothetical protein
MMRGKHNHILSKDLIYRVLGFDDKVDPFARIGGPILGGFGAISAYVANGNGRNVHCTPILTI